MEMGRDLLGLGRTDAAGPGRSHGHRPGVSNGSVPVTLRVALRQFHAAWRTSAPEAKRPGIALAGGRDELRIPNSPWRCFTRTHPGFIDSPPEFR